MMTNIAVFTSTRGDIAILSPLLKQIKQSKKINYKLFVHGTHLEKDYGKTINEIKSLGLSITKKFKSTSSLDNESGQMIGLSKQVKNINKIFKNYKFESVLILGDRLERIPIVIASIIYRKKIIHLHGGEITLGSFDDQIRHIISKSADIHFVICENYKKNLIKMGEDQKKIFNHGSLGVENAMKFIKKTKNKNTTILTYHPETANPKFNWLSDFKQIFQALSKFKYKVIITAPGQEKGSIQFIKQIKKIIKANNKFTFIKSLGYKKYFNILNNCAFIIGNSSSGIIEIPYYKIPTINIGDRQKGRFCHQSIINTKCRTKKIVNAIKLSQTSYFQQKLKRMKLYFGKGNSSKKIVKTLENFHK